MTKLPTVLICSFALAFFGAFIACYFLAKITSAPKKEKTEEGEYDLNGIKYDCVVKDVQIHSRATNVYKVPPSNTKFD